VRVVRPACGGVNWEAVNSQPSINAPLRRTSLPEQFFRLGLPFAQSTGGCLQWLDTVMLPELTGGLVGIVSCCHNHNLSNNP